MTTRKHYHVCVNMAGYMPDSDPEVHLTRYDAERSAAWHKEQFLEQGEEVNGRWVPEYKATGSLRSGLIQVDRYGDSRYSLPYYIHIDGPCRDAGCADWFDEEGNVVEM